VALGTWRATPFDIAVMLDKGFRGATVSREHLILAWNGKRLAPLPVAAAPGLSQPLCRALRDTVAATAPDAVVDTAPRDCTAGKYTALFLAAFSAMLACRRPYMPYFRRNPDPILGGAFPSMDPCTPKSESKRLVHSLGITAPRRRGTAVQPPHAPRDLPDTGMSQQHAPLP